MGRANAFAGVWQWLNKDIMQQRPISSGPLPQRMSAADTNEYVQPMPRNTDYLTFWIGNQIPPTGRITPIPHAPYVKVSSQDNRTPRLAGGTFGPNLGQLQTTRMVARMRAAWTNRAGGRS